MRKEAELVYNGIVNVPNILIEYKGFEIRQKLDFGGYPYQNVNTYKKGYVVVQDHTNVLAGGTWSKSIIEAKVAIDCHIEAKGDSFLFWKLLNEHQGLGEWEEV